MPVSVFQKKKLTISYSQETKLFNDLDKLTFVQTPHTAKKHPTLMQRFTLLDTPIAIGKESKFYIY